MTHIRICLFSVCIGICVQAQIFNEGGYLSDYPPFYPPDSQQDKGYTKNSKPEIVRQHSGSDIILKCNITSCMYHKHRIIWEFQECQFDYKKTPCSVYYETNDKVHTNKTAKWNKIPSEQIIKKKCSFNLHVRNINENQNGLYRCMENGKVIKTYEIEVIGLLSLYLGHPPELLDIIPSNITINQSMQIVMQCKVYSRQPPVIWWFKQSDGRNYDIYYSDKYYSRVNTSVQVYAVPNKVNVYLSKLNIYHARETDSGIYVCVAMTEGGKDYKDAVVNVITLTNDCQTQSSFILLFLIPSIFVLIPIIVWLCYFRRKKKCVTHMNTRHNRPLVEPIISRSALLNEATYV